jgi:phosphatidylethanolamine/phosphatidyl-N-methylethanolamine N-methyltransferase
LDGYEMSDFSHARTPGVPHTALDADDVRAAYRRWARIYDATFGGVSMWGRRAAVREANQLPGSRVLEIGVGTGLALPLYGPEKRITGIDLSADMLERARIRAARLTNVEALLEMDAEATTFAAGEFDIAVGMFVASVVPHPRRLVGELRRIVRQPFRGRARTALVGGAGAGAGLPRAWLAPGFLAHGAVRRR